ncbi:MAG: APC family permease, partial [Halobacteria archaeon]|nr:APC family permease [Halobacteria archaeon]
MTKELERDLGLYATITISIGAMIGSGIFVLPGKAFKFAGPAVILAYFLAGLTVVPAALSKSEMATAMPEAGGTYLYIDRAMGPLLGTIAGIGAWFSLVFKSAFALVGLGTYLVLFVKLPTYAVSFLSFSVTVRGVKIVSLVLGVLLILVNIVGVKQTGRLQAAIVTAVLVVLGFFVVDGVTYVESTRYHPFLTRNVGGLLEATGFVFVSYAGVTKIASVAEEIEDPGRNIPLGILSSVSLMMLVYTLIVFVIVGVTEPTVLKGTLTPMAAAAESFMGNWAYLLVAGIAVLSLTSMANAGILSSSRYPLAMSRDSLSPESLGTISQRFKTPVRSIGLTGGILLVLISFVPVIGLAKLASAFQILVFSIINVALIAFRESGLTEYEPEFTSPGYPWVQILGLVAGLVLLTQMGSISIAGAVGIIVVGVLWYEVYGREKTEREGAALDALRKRSRDFSVDRIRQRYDETDEGILVAFDRDTRAESGATMTRLARDVVSQRGGFVNASLFRKVPQQTSLASAAESESPHEGVFEDRVDSFTRGADVDFETEVIVGHDLKAAVLNHAERKGVSAVMGEWVPEHFHGEMLGMDVDWYMENARQDMVFVRNRGLDKIDEVVVFG